MSEDNWKCYENTRDMIVELIVIHYLRFQAPCMMIPMILVQVSTIFIQVSRTPLLNYQVSPLLNLDLSALWLPREWQSNGEDSVLQASADGFLINFAGELE